ncbi:hypothetical protein EBB07_34500 [Paenibacillaceae bacterium]|nr:hypothetical protein EBB07_34500 [Paenibacillaceae bacterium]
MGIGIGIGDRMGIRTGRGGLSGHTFRYFAQNRGKARFGGHQIRYLCKKHVFVRVFVPIAERLAVKIQFGCF